MADGAPLRPAPAWVRAAAAVVRRLPAGRYRAMNWLPRAVPPFEARLPRELGGAAFRCDLRDAIAREACLTGRYEPQETALVRALLRPGDTFVDVGANWGYFSLVAAGCVAPHGRVVAFEPDPRLHPALAANLTANGLRDARVVAAAAADAAGTLRLSGFEESGGNWGLSSLVAESGGAAFEVPAVTVDDALDGLGVGAVALLKLDVEGAERAVLAGMARGLAAGRYRRLLVELHPTLVPDGAALRAAVRATLEGHGYLGRAIDHSPEAARRAAYGRGAPALLPLDAAADDPWPHQLWTLPGDETR